jgi:FAD/FMN-containing dehydrogenase
MPLLLFIHHPMIHGILCNDIHSKLNPTRVAKVFCPTSTAEVVSLVRQTVANGGQLSICGARHAMGGQQFGEETVLVDCSLLTDIGTVDVTNGWVELGAGVKWRELIDALIHQQAGLDTIWTIRQKQTGADDLTIAGSLSANAHGRGLRMRPIIDDVEAFTLIDAQGEIRRCSRADNSEFFRLAIGGYGCFGIITSVCLRLSPRLKLRRSVEVTTVDLLIDKLKERVAAGGLYGDFQFSIDENSPDFLNRGVLSTYQPVDACLPMPLNQEGLGKSEWMRLLRLAHDDRTKGFEEYSSFYLRTHGGLYWSDTHQLSVYIDDYHSVLDQESCAAVPASEMISELYVPRERLVAFMAAAAICLRKSGVPVIYGTVRLIEKDQESFLSWAREDFACVIFNLHTEHSDSGIANSGAAFRALIDEALALGGSFFLTYHRWATRSQIEQAYPQFSEFLRQKDAHDPEGLLQSEWWRHHRDLFSAS